MQDVHTNIIDRKTCLIQMMISHSCDTAVGFYDSN